MGGTGVCDHIGRFIFFSTGYFGSFNDSYAYKRIHLYTHADRFFRGEEYLLADAAYSLSPTVMPRIRNARRGSEKARFNSYHGQARVKIEHAFGMLKRKSQSLRNLPVLIKKKRDMYKAASWIKACVVLHNFLREGLEDELVDDDIDDDAIGVVPDDLPEGCDLGNRNNDMENRRKRMILMNWVLHYRRLLMARRRQ